MMEARMHEAIHALFSSALSLTLFLMAPSGRGRHYSLVYEGQTADYSRADRPSVFS